MANEVTYADVAEEIEKDQYLIFNISSQEYAIQAMKVQEISAVLQTTQVPTAPPYIEGILNLRGQLATVINFRKKFRMEPRPQDEDTRIIIIEHGGYPIGLIVDSVEEVIRIADDKLQKLPEAAETSVSQEYISGVGMLDKRLIIILDSDKVLSKSELAEAEAARQEVMEETSETA